MSTALRTPVDDVEPTLAYRYVCCLFCHREWELTVWPIHCQDCMEPAQLGRLETARKRVRLRNGL